MMDARMRTDSGTVEYYLSRLIQRAIVEPKPLLRIYEEECQRHADISVTVSFKEFQAALQKHCMTLQSRNQQIPAALQAKHQELREAQSRLNALGQFADQARKRRRLDTQTNPPYHRAPPSAMERFSPQANIYRNGVQPASAQVPSIKLEALLYPSPPVPQPPSHTVSRPPSANVPPIEEEPPPEFIEMSSNPPRLLGVNNYQNQLAVEQNDLPPASGPVCKTEPKDASGSSDPTIGAAQSSSPADRNNSLLNIDNGPISPLKVRCVKCIAAMITCAVMPCGHCCLCSICGQTVLSLKQVCPVCRKSVSNIVAYTNIIYNVYR